MDELIEEIYCYYYDHGRYPNTIKVSRAFYGKYADYLLALGIKLAIHFKKDETVGQWELE